MTKYLVIVAAFVLGAIFGRLSFPKKCAGTLRVDRSDPTEAPYLFLELEPGGMDEIHKNETVIFKVDLNGYMPRK